MTGSAESIGLHVSKGLVRDGWRARAKGCSTNSYPRQSRGPGPEAPRGASAWRLMEEDVVAANTPKLRPGRHEDEETEASERSHRP